MEIKNLSDYSFQIGRQKEINNFLKFMLDNGIRITSIIEFTESESKDIDQELNKIKL